MQVEKLIDAAIDLRVATLRAREQGIINFTEETKGSSNERFQIYSEKDFMQIIKTRPYKIVQLETYMAPYKYRYEVKVSGLNFTHLTTDLLNADDERLVENEA